MKLGAIYFDMLYLATPMSTENHCSFQLGTTGEENAAITGAAGENTSGAGTE